MNAESKVQHVAQEQVAMQVAHDLFRAESVIAARSPLGAPVRLAGVATWLMSLFFLALFSIAIIYICTSHYSRKETVQGQVTAIAGAPRIMASRNGVAAQVLVHEGQVVVAVQELISVTSTTKLIFR